MYTFIVQMYNIDVYYCCTDVNYQYTHVLHYIDIHSCCTDEHNRLQMQMFNITVQMHNITVEKYAITVQMCTNYE